MRIIIISVLTLFSMISTANAGESLFGYMYTTDLLPEGRWELEQWITDRDGQAQGRYHHFDMSTEFEYGVLDHFQTALYIDYRYLNASGNSVRGLTEGLEIPYDHDSKQPYSNFKFEGLKWENIYRVFSPVVDPIGLALYVEPEWGVDEMGLEFRLILQKDFLDDQFVLVSNLWVEFSREKGSNLVDPGSTDVPNGSWTNATFAEFDLGASYRALPRWSFGIEFRNHNEFAGYSLNRSEQDHTAFFIGPNVHYGDEHWFFTLVLIRQIKTFAYSEDQRTQVYNGLLYGDEHTAWDGIRLQVGFPF